MLEPAASKLPPQPEELQPEKEKVHPKYLVGLELESNGPVNTIKVMSSWSVYLTTLFPGQA